MRKDTISFVTLYPRGTNVELAKDVGQIPYALGKYKDIDSSLACCFVEQDGANKSVLEGLSFHKLKTVLKSPSISGLVFLLKNSKSIDWLNIYHCGRRAYYWTKVYKFLNPQGKVYLKLDLDFMSCDVFDSNEKERKLFKKVTGAIDLVSVESQAVLDRIQKYAGCELKLISNGYNELDEEIDFTGSRENRFITVGRLGTEQKATDVLLEAFVKTADKHNWILELVGTVEPEFEPVKQKFYEENPGMKERVIFTGPISDRSKLYYKYAQSKVFVLPSRWESFALVGPEALSCGCRMILSEGIPPMYEVTNNEKYGRIVPIDNADVLADAMLEATKHEYNEEEVKEIVAYAKEHFSWGKICEKLYDYLKEL